MRFVPISLALVALLAFVNVVHAKTRVREAPPCQGDNWDLPACVAYRGYVQKLLWSHTPPSTGLGSGFGEVTFKVLASGQISVVKNSGSDAAHAEMALSILKSIRFKPPPGPYALIAQTFVFH